MKSPNEQPNNPESSKQFAHFLNRVLHFTWVRVKESRETIAYVSIILFSTLLCIILEGLIADAHTKAAAVVMGSDVMAGNDPNVNSALGSGVDASDPYLHILVSLRRLKDENVFFVLFQVFQLYLGVDAIVRQSVIQLMAHTANEFLSMVFAFAQMGETIRWRSKMNIADEKTNISTDETYFYVALHREIGLAVSLAVLTCVFAFLCWKLLQQFGWNVYKRIGADLELQGTKKRMKKILQRARFRLCQIFLLNLKLDAFFHMIFSVFWIVVMTQEGYLKASKAGLAWYILHILLTIVQIPAIFVARYGICAECPRMMYLFLLVQALIAVDFVVVLQQSATSWVFWVLAVCLAIILSISTIFLAIRVMHNFDKGLKPYLELLFSRNYEHNVDPTSGNVQRDNSWVIDDGDSDQQPPPQQNGANTPPIVGEKAAQDGHMA
ncbi:hypothetical protein EC973_008078 [Apophysomyces ossiformis]|uniref:Uncharacterized protein n=1 Tax=Apophysomyces ossiformis TaxID=679940 RepID=A0A8H7BNZ1_9FUNG|nr:hypothetical protein EC973_008078 [Apophysomyces ossiformis]